MSALQNGSNPLTSPPSSGRGWLITTLTHARTHALTPPRDGQYLGGVGVQCAEHDMTEHKSELGITTLEARLWTHFKAATAMPVIVVVVVVVVIVVVVVVVVTLLLLLLFMVVMVMMVKHYRHHQRCQHICQ